MVELRQALEYEGLLEGLPTRERNEASIAALVEEQSSTCGTFLIEPRQEPIEYERYPFGEPAALPSVRCIGRFQSATHVDPEAHCSEVIVLWWQSEFGIPSDEAVLAPLRRIDWARYASDRWP